MLEMNKVMLIGNLTRDPEMSHLTSGTALGKMGLAVNRRYKSQSGEYQEETAFVDVTVFGKTAEFVQQYMAKGTRVYVEGRLNFSSWEAQDGSKRSKLDVVGDRIQFALPKKQQDAQATPPSPPPLADQIAPPQAPPAYAPPPQAPPQAQPTPDSDDLPF